MQSAAHRGSLAEWRIPPSRCRAQAIRVIQHYRVAKSRSELAAAVQDEAAVFSIPESRDEAVNVSVSALLSQIKGLSGAKKARKGFGSSTGGSGSRFSIELPLPSDSPAELVQFCADILSRIPSGAAAGACVVFASEQAASAAADNQVLQRSSRVVSLQQACRADSLNGALLLVAPTTADVALVEQLLDDVWCGPWALLLNPTWHNTTPTLYQPLVDSFNTLYSFMPIATQGLMRVEGAVVRHVSGKSSSSSPWRVLVTEKEQFVQVGQMQKRPESSDLELVLINARAAKSPLTSLVKGVKGILDRGKK